MNLDTLLDIFGRNIDITTKHIEKRREVPLNRHPLDDSREQIGIYIVGEPNIEEVLPELLKIKIYPKNENIMAYRKDLYYELYDRLNNERNKDIEASVLDILKPFKEYSYSMYPDTLYQNSLNVFENATNESCATYLWNPTPNMIANAKAIILECEKSKSEARGRFFKEYICDILSKDIVIRTASYLHLYVVEFAVMLDCVLLQNGYDLLELQTLHNIKLLDDHKEVLLSNYIGSERYTKKLLSNVCKENHTGSLSLQLTPEIDTPEARKYFTRAVEKYYIEPTNSGAKLLVPQARLGYLCSRIYRSPRPISYLERFFNITKLSASITQATYPAKRADVIQWRAEIDTNIFYD